MSIFFQYFLLNYKKYLNDNDNMLNIIYDIFAIYLCLSQYLSHFLLFKNIFM